MPTMAPISKEVLEWAKSSEAAESGFDLKKIRGLEIMWRKQEAFVARVQRAFLNVTLGDGTGLFEANGIDDGFDREKQQNARAKDERNSWMVLSPDELSYGRSALCFTDADGFRFLIPAFMLADLTGDLDDCVVIHLSHTRDDRFDRLSSLNGEQVDTIFDFMELFLEDPDCHFHHADIRDALKEFWKPLSEQRRQEEKQTNRNFE